MGDDLLTRIGLGIVCSVIAIALIVFARWCAVRGSR